MKCNDVAVFCSVVSSEAEPLRGSSGSGFVPEGIARLPVLQQCSPDSTEGAASLTSSTRSVRLLAPLVSLTHFA